MFFATSLIGFIALGFSAFVVSVMYSVRQVMVLINSCDPVTLKILLEGGLTNTTWVFNLLFCLIAYFCLQESPAASSLMSVHWDAAHICLLVTIGRLFSGYPELLLVGVSQLISGMDKDRYWPLPD